MSKQDTKRYQDYADNIFYAPNINKNLFSEGGSEEGDTGGGGGDKIDISSILQIAGKAVGQGLSEIGQWRQQKWNDKQNDELTQFKRVEAGNQAYRDWQNTLQENRNNRIQQSQLLSQQAIADRNQKQAQALATINGGSLEPNKFLDGGLLGAAIALDKGLGSAIGGEYHSGAGDVISKIPGLGLVGGVTNALFGTKVDKAKLQAVDAAETNLTNSAMAAGTVNSFEQIQGPQAVNYASANAYSGGLFSKSKARKKNAELRQRLKAAEDFANRGVDNGVDNITKNQNNMLASTYYAYGGVLQPYSPEFNLKALGGYTDFGDGAIGYSFINDYLHNGYLNATKENKLDALNTNDVYLSNGNTMFAEGGNINTTMEDYQEGNIYNIDEEEYRKLLEEGYQVEIINN